jgi:hypothetical protein
MRSAPAGKTRSAQAAAFARGTTRPRAENRGDARADGELQVDVIGQQFAGRVGLFLRVEDFDELYLIYARGGAPQPLAEA